MSGGLTSRHFRPESNCCEVRSTPIVQDYAPGPLWQVRIVSKAWGLGRQKETIETASLEIAAELLR
ncbi:hypothetical protein BMS3Bbin10_02029 [bacterium BMS3Bbin10]|nr:hypothetical protein BMS3Bbin10_02029 [bacterium BMS3Bbin10]